ncbi:MAG: hypothetical protein GF333_07645 [Candidatus Omnitrophica bacterium]|nr:hypothetical protein [Candidatus Omnitrophota bacterium]
MERIIELFKERNIRVTPQRVGVMQTLYPSQEHLTVEGIHAKVKPQFPNISLATVYTILELFKEKKLVREIRVRFDRSLYESRVDPHHHFHCTQCGQTYDVDIDLCPTLKKQRIDGHSINDFHGYFYGICRSCRKEKQC